MLFCSLLRVNKSKHLIVSVPGFPTSEVAAAES